MTTRGARLEQPILELLRCDEALPEEALAELGAGPEPDAEPPVPRRVDIDVDFGFKLAAMVARDASVVRGIREDLEHVDLASVGPGEPAEVCQRRPDRPTWQWMARNAPLATTLVTWFCRIGVVRGDAHRVLDGLYGRIAQ